MPHFSLLQVRPSGEEEEKKVFGIPKEIYFWLLARKISSNAARNSQRNVLKLHALRFLLNVLTLHVLRVQNLLHVLKLLVLKVLKVLTPHVLTLQIIQKETCSKNRFEFT